MLILWLLIPFFARLFVGILFIVAGWAKLRTEQSVFLRAVLAYELLPQPLASAFALSLPLLEVVLGLMLMFGLLIQPTVWLGLALLVIVTGAVIIALIQGKTISCGCFGPKDKVTPMRWTIVARNLFLMVALSSAFLKMKPFFALDNILQSHVGNMEHWVLGIAIASIIGLFLHLYAQRLAIPTSHVETSK